jgi:NADP-dependent 3-hydroxy acid dehydrogenase YdfG
MNKIAFITGASAGIGKATAMLLAENNYNLIVAARRLDRLEELKAEIEAEFEVKVLPLQFDIQNRQQCLAAINSMPEEWKKINVLINNAGLGLTFEPSNLASFEDWETMLDTNIKGLISNTHILLPYLLNAEDAHIINIGSTAAKQVKKGSGVYSATKFAVDAFTKGLRIDLLEHNVKVSLVNPGIVETEFALVKAKGNRKEAKEAYAGYTPLQAIDIAETVLFVLNRPKHVTINDILITPLVEADMNNLIHRIIE